MDFPAERREHNQSLVPFDFASQVAHWFQYTVEGRQLAVFTAEMKITH